MIDLSCLRRNDQQMRKRCRKFSRTPHNIDIGRFWVLFWPYVCVWFTLTGSPAGRAGRSCRGGGAANTTRRCTRSAQRLHHVCCCFVGDLLVGEYYTRLMPCEYSYRAIAEIAKTHPAVLPITKREVNRQLPYDTGTVNFPSMDRPQRSLFNGCWAIWRRRQGEYHLPRRCRSSRRLVLALASLVARATKRWQWLWTIPRCCAVCVQLAV